MTAHQGNVKWAYLNEGRTEFQLPQPDGLRKAFERIVPALEAGVLIE
jgi:hypothetical protein